MNKKVVLQNRKGWNLFRWLWLSTNLFVTVKFHDIEAEIAKLPEGGTIYLLPYEYLSYKTIKVSHKNVNILSLMR